MHQPPAIEIDAMDRKILRELQRNAEYSMAELGEIVGLSHTPCWRRIKRLEACGVIRQKVTLLDPKKLNLGVSVHAYVSVKNYEEGALSTLEEQIQGIPEIVECYSISGDSDYLLRLVVDSIEHYEEFLKKTLLHLPNIGSIESSFALKQVKYSTELPL